MGDGCAQHFEQGFDQFPVRITIGRVREAVDPVEQPAQCGIAGQGLQQCDHGVLHGLLRPLAGGRKTQPLVDAAPPIARLRQQQAGQRAPCGQVGDPGRWHGLQVTKDRQGMPGGQVGCRIPRHAHQFRGLLMAHMALLLPVIGQRVGQVQQN